METIDIPTSHRDHIALTGADYLTLEDYLHNKIVSGDWIEDDGSYYLAADWEAQYEDEHPDYYASRYTHRPLADEYPEDDIPVYED